MKKTILLFMFLFAMSADSVERWEPFTDAAEHEGLNIDLLQSDMTGLEIEISLPGMWVDEIKKTGNWYHRLRIPSAGRTADIGLPEMPYVGRLIAVPHGADVRISVEPLDSLVFSDITPWPAQESRPDVPGARLDFQKNDLFYGGDGRYPQKVVRVSDKKIIRGCETSLIGVFPMQYDPSTRKLRIYTRLRIRIAFLGGEEYFVEERLRSRFFEPLLAGTMLNYSPSGDDGLLGSTRADEGEMVILVPDAMYGTIMPLAEWRTQSGLQTIVTKLSDVGANASGIQQYISDAYENWETPPSFVLLVGDSDLMPTNYYTFHPWQMNMTAADLYYFTVDGSDLFADIHYGRISVNNASQLQGIVNKLLAYEKDPLPGAWNNHVFLASYEEYGYYFTITSNKIFSFLTSLGYDCDRAYENGNPPGNTADVINNFNEGCFVVNHRDHGGRENWVHPAFYTYHFSQLENEQMLPVVFSINCLSGYFDAETDETPGTFECFSEQLLRMDSGGAMGVIASSRTSYSGYNDELNMGLYDAMWPGFDPAYPGSGSGNPWSTPVYRQGAVLNYAKWYMYDKYVLTGGAGYDPWYPEPWMTKLEYEMYHFHGDPSLEVHTAQPAEMVVSHESIAAIGIENFCVSVDVEGALAALSMDGQLIGRAYVEGGVADISFEEPTSIPGIMKVVVTRHNYELYEGEVELTALTGWYVVIDSVMKNDYWGHVDGTVEQGDSIGLRLRLWNMGDQTAPGVVARLSTVDPAAVVVNDSQAYGSIPADGRVTSGDDYRVALQGGVEDGHLVPFEVEISSSDSLWVRQFTMEIHSPLLEFRSLQIDDSNGNSNGFVDPGETVVFWVRILNNGSGAATSVNAILASESEQVDITSSDAAYPDISPAGSEINSTHFEVSFDSDCSAGDVIPFALDVEAFGPYGAQVVFQVLIGGSTILVVDSDSESTEGRLLDAMDVSGYPYRFWHVPSQGPVPLDTLRLYKAIVWTAGDNNVDSMSDTHRQRMSEYLSEGGSLLFSAENYLSAYGSRSFTSDYLHVSDYTISIEVENVKGVTDDPITNGMNIPTDFPGSMSNRPDEIVPDVGAAGILKVGFTPQFTALRYPASGSSTYRMIFLATPFEALEPGHPDPSNPETFMKNALDWLLESSDTVAPNQITDLVIGLGESPMDLVLNWSVPWDNIGIDHYKVYRDTEAYFQPGVSTTVLLIYSNTWTDVGAAGDPENNHYYMVTALDAALNESLLSSLVGATDFQMVVVE